MRSPEASRSNILGNSVYTYIDVEFDMAMDNKPNCDKGQRGE